MGRPHKRSLNHESQWPFSSTQSGTPVHSITGTLKLLLTWQILFSLHSVLKEFFDPLRSDDPRADFFAVYRKESDEFDRDYAKKYDEDLNTSLIFVSDSVRMCPLGADLCGYSGRFILCS